MSLRKQEYQNKSHKELLLDLELAWVKEEQLQLDVDFLTERNVELTKKVALLERENVDMKKDTSTLQNQNYDYCTKVNSLTNYIKIINNQLKTCVPQLSEFIDVCTNIDMICSHAERLGSLHKKAINTCSPDVKTQAVTPQIVNGHVLINPTINLLRINDEDIFQGSLGQNGSNNGTEDNSTSETFVTQRNRILNVALEMLDISQFQVSNLENESEMDEQEETSGNENGSTPCENLGLGTLEEEDHVELDNSDLLAGDSGNSNVSDCVASTSRMQHYDEVSSETFNSDLTTENSNIDVSSHLVSENSNKKNGIGKQTEKSLLSANKTRLKITKRKINKNLAPVVVLERCSLIAQKSEMLEQALKDIANFSLTAKKRGRWEKTENGENSIARSNRQKRKMRRN